MEGRVGDVRFWRPGGLHCFGVVGVGKDLKMFFRLCYPTF